VVELDWVHLVHRPLFGLLYQPKMIADECRAVVGMRICRGNRSTRRKHAPVPFCPPQNPWPDPDSNPAAVVESQWLTAWAMARPLLIHIRSCNWMHSFTWLSRYVDLSQHLVQSLHYFGHTPSVWLLVKPLCCCFCRIENTVFQILTYLPRLAIAVRPNCLTVLREKV
jgi:hypothetical protein